MPLCAHTLPSQVSTSFGVIRVQVHSSAATCPCISIRFSVNNGPSRSIRPFSPLHKAAEVAGGVESRIRHNIFGCAERVANTPYFQLFPARLGIFRNHAVFLQLMRQHPLPPARLQQNRQTCCGQQVRPPPSAPSCSNTNRLNSRGRAMPMFTSCSVTRPS